MRNLLDKYRALRAPDGVGSGGGDGGDGGAGGGGGSGFNLPQGFPDAYKGATAEETLGKLWGGFSEVNTRAEGLRTKLAGMPKAPEKPDSYVYEPSDRLKPFFGDMAKDPILPLARNAFHKHGIPQEAFSGIIEEIYGPAVEAGLIQAPFDPKAEISTFMKETGMDAVGATKALTDADAFAKGLFGQLKDVPEGLKADVEAQLLGLTDTAAGNVLLRALSGRLAENGIRIGGESTAMGELTAEDLKKLDADPRIDPQNRNHSDPAKRFDEDLRRKYDAAYARLQPANKTAW